MRLVRSGRTVQLSIEVTLDESGAWQEIVPSTKIPAELRPKVRFYSVLATSGGTPKTVTIAEHRTNGSIAVPPTPAGTFFGTATWVT